MVKSAAMGKEGLSTSMIRRLGFVRTLATAASSAGPAGPTGVQAAESIVQGFLKSPPTTVSLRKALVACTDIEAAYRASARADYHELPGQRDVKEAEKLLTEVLSRYAAGPAKITNQTLLEFLTHAHPPSTAAVLKVLRAFSADAKTNVVPEKLAMIPFRRAVYEADFRGALDVMEHTCGARSNYRTRMSRRLTRLGAGWSVTAGATLTGVYQALTSGYLGVWEPGTAGMICGMFGVYLAALTLYGSMTLAGSKSGLGLVLEWVPGTSPLYRYNHTEQLKMATFATELNRSLPENLGECSPQLLQDLQKINLKPVESQSEANLKEYWARGGDGFDWAEPDQDPALLLWAQHMEATRQRRIDSAYSRKDSEGKLLSWMSEVEKEKEGRSIPHASLLGVDEMRQELGSPNGRLSFEEELERDMRQIRNREYRQIGEGPKDSHTENDDAQGKDTEGKDIQNKQ